MSKPITIKDMENKYGSKFGANPRMKLSTWLRRNGLPSAGRLLDRVEKDIAQGEHSNER